MTQGGKEKMAGCAGRLDIRDALDQTCSRIPSLSHLGKRLSEFPLTYLSDEGPVRSVSDSNVQYFSVGDEVNLPFAYPDRVS